MIKTLHVDQYRKLKNIDLNFSPGVNAISGTNGTCKTSLLHMISNSLQATTKTCDWVVDSKCLPIINSINAVTNPKVEGLTRGDKVYNDPAHGKSGILFSVDYYNSYNLGFRRHNSSTSTRYAIKPVYRKGSEEKLPYCPVIYLGISRLVPFGEFQNDDVVLGIKKRLPDQYLSELAELYKSFTHYSVSAVNGQKLGDIKTRAEFSSDIEGIDSNTISAGEDNLYIILTAIISLKYYYESINSRNTVESLLLIDELDATLHPAFQIKLLRLLRDYSEKYKIQVIYTTHSMSALENALDQKDNVIYLVDNITSVVKMEEPDIHKIKMHLSSLTENDIYKGKVIPIYTEDDEARCLLRHLFDYFKVKYQSDFIQAYSYFHLVSANIGSDNLRNIFSDSKLHGMNMSSICILDGDQNTLLSNCIMCLPGKASPEEFLFEYAEKLFNEDSPFWIEKTIIDKGFGKSYYLDKIKAPIENFKATYRDEEETGKHHSKKPREFNKRLFIDNRQFFEMLFLHWIYNRDNAVEIDCFYTNLRLLFKKVAPYNGINPKLWK